MSMPLDDGPIMLSPMLGMWDQYELGSEMWAKALSMHFQYDYLHIRRDGSVAPLVRVLRVALGADTKPWEVWPAEAQKNPEAWIKLITGDDWDTVSALLRNGDPDAWVEISTALAQWEVTHRTWETQPRKAGKFAAGSDTSDGADKGRDHTRVRGYQRRLHKRAASGDEQAALLVEQLAAGEISVNQAAVEAGMRARYLRVPEDDPVKAAASLLNRKGPAWAAALAARLTELLTGVETNA